MERSCSSSSSSSQCSSHETLEAEAEEPGAEEPKEASSMIRDIIENNKRDKVCDLLPVVSSSSESLFSLMRAAAVIEHPAVTEEDSKGCIHTDIFTLFKENLPDKYKEGLQYRDSRNKSIVHCAIESDCQTLLEYLAKENCSLTEELDSGTDPLGLAAAWGKLNSMQFFLQSSLFDLKRTEKNGTSYLMRACRGLNIDAVRMLLDKKTKSIDLLEYRNERERSCVAFVLRSPSGCDSSSGRCKHVLMLKFIRKKTSDVRFKTALEAKDQVGCSPIQNAVLSNCNKLLQYLHKRMGLRLDERDNDGDIALGDAALHGKLNALKYLVQNGSDIEHRNKKGETPFLQACRGLQINEATYLADEAKADIMAKDFCENTAIHLTCATVESEENSKKFVRMLNFVIVAMIKKMLEMEAKQEGTDLKMNESQCFKKLAQEENHSKYNMMMVLVDNGNLRRFVSNHGTWTMAPWHQEQSSLLEKNSDGTNILHVYSGKFSLKELHEDFQKSQFSEHWDKLIRGKVQQGYYKGYGCLHFACQMGHLDNINYLLREYPDCMVLAETQPNDCCPSPAANYYSHLALFLVFFGLLTYFICSIESKSQWIDFVMLAFGLSFAIQEIIDFMQTVCRKRLRKPEKSHRCWPGNVMEYFTDVWNYFDILGITLLLAGLLHKLNLDRIGKSNNQVLSRNYFDVRIILTTSHVLWSFRLISFLRAVHYIGPSISMLKSLIKRDLLPFLIIFFIMCLSFGVLFVNLLYPDLRTYSPAGSVGKRDLLNLLSVYTRPLLMAFGEMDIEDMASCENLSAEWSSLNETGIPSDATCTHPVGTFHYRKYLILPFLFLINLTMLNMLIAKFSLTVSSQEDVAYMIWRRFDADLLMEYKRLPTLPPPFTVVWLAMAAVNWLHTRSNCKRRCCQTAIGPEAGGKNENKDMRWWQKKKMEEIFKRKIDNKSSNLELQIFLDFLLFQASSLRQKRSGLTKQRKDHGSMVEKLKVDIQRLSHLDNN